MKPKRASCFSPQIVESLLRVDARQSLLSALRFSSPRRRRAGAFLSLSLSLYSFLPAVLGESYFPFGTAFHKSRDITTGTSRP